MFSATHLESGLGETQGMIFFLTQEYIKSNLPLYIYIVYKLSAELLYV